MSKGFGMVGLAAKKETIKSESSRIYFAKSKRNSDEARFPKISEFLPILLNELAQDGPPEPITN